MLRPTVAALVGLYLCGCNSKPGFRYDVIVDGSASNEFVQAVLSATADWESRVPVWLGVSVSDWCSAADSVICVHPVSKLPPHPQATRDALGVTKTAADTFGLRDGADCWILSTLTGDTLTTVVDHELGHGQGLAHTGVARELMCGSLSCDAPSVAQGDISQWRRLRGPPGAR
jgi:hypothetical protein